VICEFCIPFFYFIYNSFRCVVGFIVSHGVFTSVKIAFKIDIQSLRYIRTERQRGSTIRRQKIDLTTNRVSIYKWIPSTYSNFRRFTCLQYWESVLQVLIFLVLFLVDLSVWSYFWVFSSSTERESSATETQVFQ